MKKGILFLSVVAVSLFMSFTHVKALNKIYFESDNLKIAPSNTKEVDVYIESDNDFSNVKLNFITTSNYINFYSIEYNDIFTRTVEANLTNLTSKTKVKSGTKIATVKLKASDSAAIGTTGYIRVINASVDDVKVQNASLLVSVSDDDKSSNNNLKAITSNLISIDFNKDITEYTYTIDNDIKKLDLKALPEDASAKIDISDQTLKTGENKIKITVTAENNEKKIYTITVNKKAEEKTINKTNKTNKKNNNSDNKVAKPNKSGFLILLILLVTVLFFDLVWIKNRKNK